MKEFFNITRMIEAQWKRTCNLYYTYYNRLKFGLLGVEMGKHSIVHGSVRVSLAKNAVHPCNAYCTRVMNLFMASFEW